MTKELEPKQTEDLQYFFDMTKERFSDTEEVGLGERLCLAIEYYLLENAETTGDSLTTHINGKSGEYLIFEQFNRTELSRRYSESGDGRSTAEIPGLEIYGSKSINRAELVLDAIRKYHEANPDAILPFSFGIIVFKPPVGGEELLPGENPGILFKADPFEQEYPKLEISVNIRPSGPLSTRGMPPEYDADDTRRVLELIAKDLGINTAG